MPRCPCRGWTYTAPCMALTTHSETWAQMPSLPLPLWCQTLKGKNFYYLKGPPVQCLFFFFPFFRFLNAIWKQACFIYSKYIPQVRKQTKKVINLPKKVTHMPSHTTLKMVLLR